MFVAGMRVVPHRLAVRAMLGLTLVSAVACSSPGETSTRQPTGDAEMDSADQVAFGFRTLLTDEGLLRAEIFADTALFLDQSTRAALRQVHGEFFGSTGAKEATVSARLGKFDTKGNSLEAWGNVVITSVDGRVLRTPMIRYDQVLNLVTSDSSFVLTSPGDKEMRGIGFKSDPNLTAVTVVKMQSGRGGTVTVPDR
jgi:LPS export ABC transporter protein LptC